MPEIQKVHGYAMCAHRNQTRKYTNEPYITHPLEVATILQLNVPSATDSMICAALLHDVLEDTDVIYKNLLDDFGKEVADLVLELTDTTTLSMGNRKYRKQLELERLKTVSKEAKTIKLADCISNSKSILEHDTEFSKVYCTEIRKLLNEALFDGDSILRKDLDSILTKSGY